MNVQTWLDPGFKITPDNDNHQSLESRVDEYLKNKGFITCAATYHEVMDPQVQKLLMSKYSLTALYIRGRADRLALHKEKGIEFEWECKTHISQKYHDLCVEIIPLIHHHMKRWLGVHCLYAFEINGFEGGFWMENMPPLREAWLPPRKEYEDIRDDLKLLIYKVFGRDLNIIENYAGGSRDPYFVIDKSEIKKCKHWKILIDELKESSTKEEEF